MRGSQTVEESVKIMKKVVISGYYGFNNAGDEAILSGLLFALREEAAKRGKKISFTVLSAAPSATAARYGVKAVGRLNLWQIIKEIGSCDLFLSGGGGLLQDSTGRSLSVVYYLGLVFLARLLGKRAVLYAHGIGPVEKPFNRRLMRLANLARQVSVRDEASLEELRRLGVNRPPVELTADPVFLLQPREPAFSLREKDRPLFALAVRPGKGEEHYLKEIALAADRLAEEFGASLVLIPMYPGMDLPVTKKLASMLQAEAEVLGGILDPRELLGLFACFDLVISVRLHALIFAAAAGVPMVGIGYDPKVTVFLERLDLSPAGSTLDLNAEVLLAQARERMGSGQVIKEKSEQLRTQAKKTVAGLAELLFESGEEP